MNDPHFGAYTFVGLVTLFFAWRKWRSYKMKPILAAYLAKGALVIDVRSPSEFAGGHVEGSVNIPLSELPRKVSSLDKKRPTIVCCASGMRSGAALGVLMTNKFESVINGGPWQNVLSAFKTR